MPTGHDPNDPPIARPARYGAHAWFADGRRDVFWSDDPAAVLARHHDQVADPAADFSMAFDFSEIRELALFIAEFDRPVLDPDGRPIRRSAAELKQASDRSAPFSGSGRIGRRVRCAKS